MLLSFLLPCLCTVVTRPPGFLPHCFFLILFFSVFFAFFTLPKLHKRFSKLAAVHACHACYIDKKSAVINFLSLVSVFGYTADTTETLKRKTILISTLWFCLFVRNRGDTIQYHSSPRSRELGQGPILLVFLTPRQEALLFTQVFHIRKEELVSAFPIKR